jgi:hypothetical protein
MPETDYSLAGEIPKIRRMFGLALAFPTNRSGFWKDEFLSEEEMAILRPIPQKPPSMDFREKQREAQRRRSLSDSLVEEEKRKAREAERDEAIKAEEMQRRAEADALNAIRKSKGQL